MHHQLHRATCGLLLVLCCCLSCTIAKEPACKPQGLLRLDKPYHSPHRIILPFCEKYQCSCCNASHALTIQRAMRPLLTDEDISLPCKAGLVSLACRLCDPEVGVGNVTTICESTCDEVFRACSEDYFAYDESSGHITPCTSQGLVCSQLVQVVQSGAEFCTAAGYIPSTLGGPGEPCFDGTPVAPNKCSAAAPGPASPPPSTSKRRSKAGSGGSGSGSFWPWKLKRRHKRQLQAAAQAVAGGVVAAAIAVGVVTLLQRVMQPSLLGTGGAHAARDRLAAAAEARAAAGPGQQQHLAASQARQRSRGR